jgi:hypothetical protein
MPEWPLPRAIMVRHATTSHSFLHLRWLLGPRAVVVLFLQVTVVPLLCCHCRLSPARKKGMTLLYAPASRRPLCTCTSHRVGLLCRSNSWECLHLS